MVDVFVIQLFHGTVHLQIHFFVCVFELQSGDEVLFLKINLGEVVHGLGITMLVPLPLDMAHYCHHHAEEHHNDHQAHTQAQGCKVQRAVGFPAYVGADGVRKSILSSLAVGPTIECGAVAHGLTISSDGAGPAIETRSGATDVDRLFTVASRVARRAGAAVVIHAVDAGGAIRTRVPGALVDVDLAAWSSET